MMTLTLFFHALLHVYPFAYNPILFIASILKSLLMHCASFHKCRVDLLQSAKFDLHERGLIVVKVAENLFNILAHFILCVNLSTCLFFGRPRLSIQPPLLFYFSVLLYDRSVGASHVSPTLPTLLVVEPAAREAEVPRRFSLTSSLASSASSSFATRRTKGTMFLYFAHFYTVFFLPCWYFLLFDGHTNRASLHRSISSFCCTVLNKIVCQ